MIHANIRQIHTFFFLRLLDLIELLELILALIKGGCDCLY